MKPRIMLPSEADIEWMRQIREEIRQSEGLGGQCGWVAEHIHNRYGWVSISGMYLAASLEPIGDHVWNLLPDGHILDSTADQFCEGHDIRLIAPDAPDAARYRSEWSEDYNPGMTDDYPELAGIAWSGEFDWELSRRLRVERGEGWWLPDPAALREWHPVTGYGAPDLSPSP